MGISELILWAVPNPIFEVLFLNSSVTGFIAECVCVSIAVATLLMYEASFVTTIV